MTWNHALEQRFAEKFGVKYAIAMNSGTATLHSALLAAGIRPGDEVISPALTVIMDATATIHAGAKPVFADIDPMTFNIDPLDISRKITKRTKAIIAVALYGLPPDMQLITTLAKDHDLVVIEDNAQAVNPDFGLKGHFASYSFETTKHISCGEGGMLITNDPVMAQAARKFAGHGYKSLTASRGGVDREIVQSPDYKRHDTIGYNYRLNELSAERVYHKMNELNELIAMRQYSARCLLDVIDKCNYLTPQFVPSGYPHSYYTLAALYDGPVTWHEFRKAFIKNGGDGFYGAWSVPYLEPALEMFDGNCPVAEEIQPKIMQFKTNYQNMDIAKQKAQALRKTIAEL